MTAADWLTSDAVTAGLARIKRENDEEALFCGDCLGDLTEAEGHDNGAGALICESCRMELERRVTRP